MNPIRLPRDLREQWIRNLNSDEWPQTDGTLVEKEDAVDKEGYHYYEYKVCALGMVQALALGHTDPCDFYQRMRHDLGSVPDDTQFTYPYKFGDQSLPSHLPRPLVNGVFKNLVLSLNDGCTFDMADVLKAKFPESEELKEWRGEPVEFTKIANVIKEVTVGVDSFVSNQNEQ